jgi:hypothetical protein
MNLGLEVNEDSRTVIPEMDELEVISERDIQLSYEVCDRGPCGCSLGRKLGRFAGPILRCLAFLHPNVLRSTVSITRYHRPGYARISIYYAEWSPNYCTTRSPSCQVRKVGDLRKDKTISRHKGRRPAKYYLNRLTQISTRSLRDVHDQRTGNKEASVVSQSS